MKGGTFTFNIRTQYTFLANDRTLSCILSGIAKKKINITGFLQTKIRNHFNFVRLVVGSPDAETKHDLRVARQVLTSLGVKFQEEKVIQVLRITPGVPGVINRIFGALWCKVKVKSFYIGEETRLFLNVSNIHKAIKILSQTKVVQCPKTCIRRPA